MLNPIPRLGAKLLSATSLLALALCTGGLSANAAETVVLKYGPFYRSVSVEALQGYAETGEATGNLASLLKFVKSEQRDSLSELMRTKLPFDVVQVDKLIRSPMGEKLLTSMASATLLPGDSDSEVLALRSAVITAAAQESGLSFGSLLTQYPTPTLTVDLPALMNLFESTPELGALMGGGGVPTGPDSTEAAPTEPPVDSAE